MKFTALQATVRELIAGHAAFVATASDNVIKDIGQGKPIIEAALQKSGFAVSVWPPARGTSDANDASGLGPVNATIVVRADFNPQKLTQADPSAYVNGLLEAIFEAVLGDEPELGGSKFQLGKEPFELMNFDEGLLAYHIRFDHFVVFG